MSRTVAAVDCGTNSIRLLLLRREAGAVEELMREVRLARLGQGVDATGEFHPDALARAFTIFDEFRALIDAHGGAELRVVATSAARDVRNRNVFEAGVRARLGIDVEVISGDEEAHLSSKGVLSGVEAPTPALVIDIGGGSTELVTIGSGNAIVHSISLNVGAVRISERFLHDDPPTPQQVTNARAFVDSELDGAGVDFGSLACAIGVAGTITSFAARALGLQTYERESIHKTVLSHEDIVAAAEHWVSTPVAQIALEPCMHPLRAAAIGGGSIILAALAAKVPRGEILVSETDILDGIALSMLDD